MPPFDHFVCSADTPQFFQSTKFFAVLDVDAVALLEDDVVDTLLRWATVGRAPPYRALPPPSPIVGYTSELRHLQAAVSSDSEHASVTVGGRVGCGVTHFCANLLLNVGMPPCSPEASCWWTCREW